jgi:hypothetical protein
MFEHEEYEEYEEQGPARVTIEDARAMYFDLAHARFLAAEEATRGNLIRRERRPELAGLAWGVEDGLFIYWNAATAYYMASEELVDWWRDNPRTTFAEFAYDLGIRHAAIVKAARKAPFARSAAETKASTRRRMERIAS